MNRSILQLNEELKSYDRILAPDFDSSYFYFPNKVESNLSHVLFNYQQQQLKKQQFNNGNNKLGVSNGFQGVETSLISYEEMTTKVDDLLNLSFQENNVNQDNYDVTDLNNDMTIFQSNIHVNTSNESLEGEHDLDNKSNKSVSPKLKFTAPRFEKKWLKTQTKYPVANSTNNTPNLYSMNCQNASEFYPKQPQQQQQMKSNFSPLKKFSEVTTATECQKNNSLNNRNNITNATKWPSQSSMKSTNKNSNQTSNNHSTKYSSHANSGKYQVSSRSNPANENETPTGNSGNNSSNGSGYRVRNSNNKQQANNRYRYNRAGSKSRA